MAFWPSSPLRKTVTQSGDVTEASDTNPVDLPGLTLTLPRAGTYHVVGYLGYTAADSTSRTTGFGFSYTGTTTSMNVPFSVGTSPAGTTRQTTMGTLASTNSDTTTNNYRQFNGRITVSSGGTLKMQFSRSAASLTFSGGILTVLEVG